MKCRGYNGQFYLMDDMQLVGRDYRFILICALFFSLLLGLNFI